MAGTISFGGVGSGMDTEGIVSGLVGASSGTLNTLKNRATETNSAVSTLSSISSLLSTLQKSVSALSDSTGVGGYAATSSGTQVAVSASGNAQPGAYNVEVLALAKEQRNYSKTFSSSSTALNQSGTLTIQVGAATGIDVSVNTGDTLDSIAAKINASGARVSASIFNDGTNYRLQVRGLDTGAANAVNFTQGSLDLGLNNTAASKVQSAQDASLKIDGFTVTRPTNQVVGAIQGVTLALTQTTTAPVTVRVASDPAALQTKLQAVVDAYNAVMNRIHSSAGYGQIKATNSVLSGDSALRSITQRLGSAVLTNVSGNGKYSTLGSIGLSTTRDGLMSLDAGKLATALQADTAGVTNLLAGSGTNSTSGVMDALSALAKNVTGTGGTLTTRSEALTNRGKSLTDQANREQDRLDRYAEALRKQFTAMDGTVASNQALITYLQRIG